MTMVDNCEHVCRTVSPMNERRQIEEEQTPPDFRLIANPFDPPTSVHLRQRLASFSIFNDRSKKDENTEILSIERRAQVNPKILSENFVQIDTSLFNEELRHRYQRASDHFCQTHLDLPTPIPTNGGGRTKNHSYSSSSSTSSLDRTRTTRHMACQTRLSLPPAADLDSLIQSFASTSEPDDLPSILPTNNTSLNASQIRRKLFSDDDDLLDEMPRRSSTFEMNRSIQRENQRSSSPSQHDHFNENFHRQDKPITPDCSPIPLKTSECPSIVSTPSIFQHATELLPPTQLPSDYARQVLDKALAELMECSM